MSQIRPLVDTDVLQASGAEFKGVEMGSRTRFYRPELDVVRFIAFFLVFLHHTLPSSHDPRIEALAGRFSSLIYSVGQACGFGLTLFFVLSAYLICELLLRERDSKGTIDVKAFYLRRILRIWPLYFFGLSIGCIFALAPGGHREDLVALGWFAVLIGNWYRVLIGTPSNPMEPLWSISVEEQFYLFAPWVIKYFTRTALYVFCLVLIVISNIWLLVLGGMRLSDSAAWANSFVQFEAFAAGMLLCLALRSRSVTIVGWRRGALICAGLLAWFIAIYTFQIRPVRYLSNVGGLSLVCGYALASIGCICILTGFIGISKTVLPRWAIWLGSVSYGLYVFHEVAIRLAGAIFGHLSHFSGPAVALKGIVAVGLNVLLAALSYRYLEAPFLRLKKRLEVVESRPV